MKGGKRNENLIAKEAKSTELQKLQEESNCFPWLHFDSCGGGDEIQTEVAAPDTSFVQASQARGVSLTKLSRAARELIEIEGAENQAKE